MFFYDLRHYCWDDPHLYKGVDGVIRCCVPEHAQGQILQKCHPEAYGGHHAEIELHTRYYNQVSIGPLSSRMLVSLYYLVMSARELAILVDVRKCL